jgi:hypothetical protein
MIADTDAGDFSLLGERDHRHMVLRAHREVAGRPSTLVVDQYGMGPT